jgi:DNA-directed RNA polymerase subunit M/transcription elongation factor TFIIS
MPTQTPGKLQLACPGCRALLVAEAQQIGQSCACPACKKVFSIAAPAERAQPERAYCFRCLRCGSMLEAHAGQAGQAGRCPTCDAGFTIPEFDPRTGAAKGHADPGDDGENPTPMHAYAAAGQHAPKLVRRPDDTLVIECPRCERQSPVSSNNCPGCGLPFTLEGATQSASAAAPIKILVVIPLVAAAVLFLVVLAAVLIAIFAR